MEIPDRAAKRCGKAKASIMARRIVLIGRGRPVTKRERPLVGIEGQVLQHRVTERVQVSSKFMQTFSLATFGQLMYKLEQHADANQQAHHGIDYKKVDDHQRQTQPGLAAAHTGGKFTGHGRFGLCRSCFLFRQKESAFYTIAHDSHAIAGSLTLVRQL